MYFVKVDSEWYPFEANDLRELVKSVSRYFTNGYGLFDKALGGCDCGYEFIEMYNLFFDKFGRISGIYEAKEHVFGDEK